MASLTIRGLESELKARLRVRAAQHGRSMEEEVRVIVRGALSDVDPTPTNLAVAIHERFRELDGVELVLPAREPMREPPKPR